MSTLRALSVQRDTMTTSHLLPSAPPREDPLVTFFPKELVDRIRAEGVQVVLEQPHGTLKCCGREDHALGCQYRAMLHPAEVDWTSAHALRWFTRRYLDARNGSWWMQWRGHRMAKLPTDCWVYQQILQDTTPDLIIETGTWEGGSAQYLGDLCALFGRGRVVSVDIAAKATPPHPRVAYFQGSSTDPIIVADLAVAAREYRTMVILDSAHDYTHVTAELTAYAPLVTPGCYLIVEDTDMFDTAMAVEHWLAAHPDWVADTEREPFGITTNHGGYLRRREAA